MPNKEQRDVEQKGVSHAPPKSAVYKATRKITILTKGRRVTFRVGETIPADLIGSLPSGYIKQG